MVTVGRLVEGRFDSLPFLVPEIIASKSVLGSFNKLSAIEALALIEELAKTIARIGL